ncbi:MAG: hypothetical protein LUI14_04895 [Lachnospiraceae bacterium]|nr:hypothetical protein [Lachnospiraceae bacterium]
MEKGKNFYGNGFRTLVVDLLLIVLIVIFASSFFSQKMVVKAETEQTVQTEQTPETEAVYTGWKTVDGSKYYYVKGKKTTGWKKISGKYYYFSSSGKLQTNKIVGSKKKGYYYVDKTGVRVTTSQIKYAVAFVVANSKSSQTRQQRLKSCFKALCKYPYTRLYDGAPTAKTAASYASYMFKNKTGNCYRYAAAMVYIARVLGYDSRLAVGGVTSSSTRSLSAHGWCEVKIGSTWKMIDCSMQRAYTNKNLFLVKRSSYPFRLRCDKTYTMSVSNGKVKWK